MLDFCVGVLREVVVTGVRSEHADVRLRCDSNVPPVRRLLQWVRFLVARVAWVVVKEDILLLVTADLEAGNLLKCSIWTHR